MGKQSIRTAADIIAEVKELEARALELQEGMMAIQNVPGTAGAFTLLKNDLNTTLDKIRVANDTKYMHALNSTGQFNR